MNRFGKSAAVLCFAALATGCNQDETRVPAAPTMRAPTGLRIIDTPVSSSPAAPALRAPTGLRVIDTPVSSSPARPQQAPKPAPRLSLEKKPR